MEKLAYALNLVSRKLHPYFQAHKIEVRIAYLLRQVLYKPEASGTPKIWAVELRHFKIEYKPRKAIKGQTLDDFILEIPHKFEVTGEECVVVPPKTVLPNNNETLWWNLYINGAFNGNSVGAGLELISPEGHRLLSYIHFGFKATNNDAKYETLIADLRLALKMKVENLNVYNDSMLIVWLIRGIFQAKGPRTEWYMRYA